MDIKKVNLYIEQYADYYNADQLPIIKSALIPVPDKYYENITAIKLLNPAYMQIASALGGVLGWDRFLLGDKKMGFVKMFLLGGCGVVALIDLFTIQKKARDKNFETMMRCIPTVSNAVMMQPVVPAVPYAPAATVYAAAPAVPVAPVTPVTPVAPVAPAVAPVVTPPVAAPVAPKENVKVPVATAPAAKAEEAAPAEPKEPAVPTIAPTLPKK